MTIFKQRSHNIEDSLTIITVTLPHECLEQKISTFATDSISLDDDIVTGVNQ